MDDVPQINSTPPGTGPDLRCPYCDYDVHGLAENRCPECGKVFDPEKIRASQAVPPLRRPGVIWRLVRAPLLAILLGGASPFVAHVTDDAAIALIGGGVLALLAVSVHTSRALAGEFADARYPAAAQPAEPDSQRRWFVVRWVTGLLACQVFVGCGCFVGGCAAGFCTAMNAGIIKFH